MDKHYENLKALFELLLKGPDIDGGDGTTAESVEYITLAEATGPHDVTGPKDACEYLFTGLAEEYGETLAKSEIMQGIVCRYVYELFYRDSKDDEPHNPLSFI